MKSIKEKAEAYDKVLEWATEAHKVCDGMLKEDLEHLFPELKESEDERIRKAIIAFFESEDDNNTYCLVPKKDILTWLEKQGEQKSIDNLTQQEAMDVAVAKCFDEQKLSDKIEPRFKFGDRVKNKKSGVTQILGSCIGDVYEGAFPFHIKDQDNWELVE